MKFTLLSEDASSRARRGVLALPHGDVQTPAFMPVGTQATVKTLDPRDLEALGAEIVLGNTYHLLLRPGHELVRRQGGLHRFMAWPRNLLTDSGGFQVFSLQERRTIDEQGVKFASHLDGSARYLSPEISMDIQVALGSDVLMAFDECPPSGAERAYHEASLARTTRWARRCKAAWLAAREKDTEYRGALFGIVQGGLHADLRARHAAEISELDLPGNALGGYSVGESPEAMRAGVAESAPLLPREKPRYLMGVGTPEDLVSCVAAGVDMFDCVHPTRTARHNLLFTSQGKLNIRSARYAEDAAPADPACACYTCRTFSRAYLRHLAVAGETLGLRLNTIHNVHFYLQLMREVRAALEAGTFDAFRRAFFARPARVE